MDTEKELMQNEKQMITTELLGLRAGLSMISQYTDEIVSEENKIEEKVQARKKKQYEEESKVAYLEKRLQEERGRSEQLKSKKEELERIWRDPLNIKIWGDYHYKFYEEYSWLDEKGANLAGWFSIVWYTFGAGLPIYLIICIVYACKTSKIKKMIVENATVEYNSAQGQLEQSQASIRNLEKQLKQARARVEESKATFETQMEEEVLPHRQKIQSIAEQAHVINQALQETYGTFLSEADWQNIDLIIHYIQTGRADNLKEALYQVDRQRQNDRIVDAIREAKEAICRHIESAFSRMGQALTLCFEKLDMRIQGLSAQMVETQKATLATSNAMLERLDTQIAATQANTALLEKANASSDELIHDLRYNQKYWVK